MTLCDAMVDASTYEYIARRIPVIGNSCSGKSTLGATLAFRVPFVELDAINWHRRWVGLNVATR